LLQLQLLVFKHAKYGATTTFRLNRSFLNTLAYLCSDMEIVLIAITLCKAAKFQSLQLFFSFIR